MWVTLLCAVMIVGGAFGEQAFLSNLYGLQGHNKVHVCLKPLEGKRARVCPGAVLHEEWVGVSAGCLRQHPLDRMLVLRLTGDETCDDITHGYSTVRSRSVRAVFYHPWSDLALVLIDRYYFNLDVHPNSTKWTVPRVLKKHGISSWIKTHIKTFAIDRDVQYHYKRMMKGMVAAHYPLFIFLVAIVLPTLAFGLVFIYVIYYTDSSYDIPYKKFKHTKKVSQV